jgi:hypothetical protein
MIGLIVATSVIGAVLVSAIIVGAIKMHRMEKNMTTLAECLLTYMTHPESVDIVEDYSAGGSKSDFNFPNSTGF